MGFQSGNKMGLGRPKGSINKRTQDFIAVLEKKGFNVAEALIWVHDQAKAQYESYKALTESGRYSPMEDQSAKFLKITGDMAKEIASYCQPKLKSIENTRPAPLEGMTLEQRLIAMKQVVAVLETEVKKSGPEGS